MITAAIITSILIIILSGAHFTYRKCFYSSKNRNSDPYAQFTGPQYDDCAEFMRQCSAVMENTEFQWLTILAKDNTPLRARYYRFSDNAPLMILFHGYRSVALRDCVGGFALGKHLGWNILAVDQRAHGCSGGETISFGILERFDCLSWCEYAVRNLSLSSPIVLYGLSMGASTILMATNLNLPKEVSCAVADCPYSTPSDIIKKVCSERGFSPKITYPLIKLGARIYGKFDLNETSATDSVRSAKIPILLIHGDDDRFVPWEMSRQIYESCVSNCQLKVFPGAGHGLCCMVDPDRYADEVLGFFDSLPELKPFLQTE